MTTTTMAPKIGTVGSLWSQSSGRKVNLGTRIKLQFSQLNGIMFRLNVY